jgi:large subunit ribosomal protein L10
MSKDKDLSMIKKLLLSEVKDMVESTKTVLVTRYAKLQPDKAWEFRRDLKKAGGQMKAIRKGIFKKYAEKYGQGETVFDGPFSVAVVAVGKEPAMDAVKLVVKYATDNKDDKVDILFGEIDGELMKGADIKYLSTLPSIEVLRAQVLSLFVSPMSQLLSVLDAAAQAKQVNE